MSTATKLEYLNETKSKIKDNINLTGAGLTNQTPFRQYATGLKTALLNILNNGIDTLYNNFPQLNDEGQNMSLTPTLEAPIKSELLGNTSQNGTPTPDAPVEVINATGEQVVKVSNGSQEQSYEINLNNIELCKIGNYQDSIRKGTGKNLFDKDGNIVEDYYLDANGNTVYATRSWFTNYYIPVISNSTYTISGGGSANRICCYDKNKTFIIRYNAEQSTYTITTPNNCHYIRISNNGNYQGLQLEKGTTATDYEPYGSKGKWLLTKKIGKVVLDGSENFTSAGTSGTDWRYNKTMSALGYASATTNNALCNSNYFVNTTKDTSRTWGTFYVNGNWLVFYDKNQNFTNATAFNNWLSTHNVSVYYVLATPTIEEITDSTLINDLNNLEDAKSYNGTTNITITAETPADLKITVLKNE